MNQNSQAVMNALHQLQIDGVAKNKNGRETVWVALHNDTVRNSVAMVFEQHNGEFCARLTTFLGTRNITQPARGKELDSAIRNAKVHANAKRLAKRLLRALRAA